MSFVKVTNSSFIRDTRSMALINTNSSEKEEYYNRARVLKNQKEQINMMSEEIQSVKSEMGEIKHLLQQLLSKQ